MLKFRAYRLLPSYHKSKGFLVVALLFVSSLLDLVSLASFIPLILLVLNPEQTAFSNALHIIQGYIGTDDTVYTGIILTIVTLILILFKTQFSKWVTFQKASYAYSIASDLASKALSKYFSIPYNKFTEVDYSREMNRITNIPIAFANNFIIPAGTILAESCIALMLLTTIAIYNVYLLLFLVAIVAPIGLLYFLKRRKLRSISKELKSTYPQLLKHTLQSIEGLTEIRAFHKEDFFKKRFEESYGKLGKIFSKDHTASVGAARITEVVAAVCIGAVIIYALLARQTYQQTLLLISIYAGVSFRAIPSINRIFAASLQMKTHEYVLEELKDMLIENEALPQEEAESLIFSKAIEICNVSFSHDPEKLILNDASLTIKKGEKIALIGKSGSGKTTLLLILMRYLKEQAGEIKLDDVIVKENHATAFRKLMGYVPQSPYILDASIEENIAFGIPEHEIDTEKVKQLIMDLDLKLWIDDLPLGTKTRIGEKGTKISGGQRQRLAIARALYYGAEVLLLDEITNQLDRQTEVEVMNVLNSFALQNKTLIFITHKPELLFSFDSVYEMKDGVLKQNGITDAFA